MGKRKGAKKAKANKPDLQKLSGEALAAEVERCRAAGDFKAMLEAAKALAKASPGRTANDFIFQAYSGRIRDLAGKGLWQEAAALLPLRDRVQGRRDSSDTRYAAYILLRTGQWEAALAALRPPGGEPDEADPLIADLLLLYPQATERADPNGKFSAGLAAVREAFAAYDEGAYAAASAALRPLGLNSPFRYWKLLLRGLAAGSGEDAETAAKCFRAIPPGLPVGDLGAELLKAVAPAAGPAPWSVHVAGIEQALKRKDPASALGAFQSLRAASPGEPMLHRIVAAYLWNRWHFLKAKVPPKLWLQLKEALGPYAGDSRRFSRTIALGCELAGLWDEAADAWKDFLRELLSERVRFPMPLPKERVAAQVLLRIAEDSAKAYAELYPGWKDERADAWATVELSLERALELEPGNPDAYLLGIRLARETRGDRELAFRWAERLVKRFPDHLYGLLEAAELALRRGVFRKGLGFLQRAERIEPLHAGVRRLRAQALVLSARKRADAGKLELARKDFEAALDFHAGPRRAELELELGWIEVLIGQGDGPARVERAVETLGGGAGALLRADVEGRLKGVDRKLRQSYKDGLRRLLAHKASAQAADLARTLRHYETGEYPAMGADRELVASYAKRCAGLECSQEDALALCELFKGVGDHSSLGLLASRSKTAFPGDYRFPVYQIHARFREA
ncbi:MAG: hypothetical protein HY900_37445, partial [Deltaproteobacteria bacterium]|nr:hypothetical protein [Deltaproteobacteria bacterium]